MAWLSFIELDKAVFHVIRKKKKCKRKEKEMQKSKKRKCKNVKWLSEEALQIAVKKERSEKQRRKGKIYPFECRVPKNSKER